jgi:hypothetical protein
MSGRDIVIKWNIRLRGGLGAISHPRIINHLILRW